MEVVFLQHINVKKRCIMKKVLLLMSAALIGLASCSKDEKEEDPIVGEWVIEKIVWSAKVTPLDECNKNMKVVITDKHIAYYDTAKINNECYSTIHEYDYQKVMLNGKGYLKNVGNREKAYYYSLEENNTKLRLSLEESTDYTIFKRKQ